MYHLWYEHRIWISHFPWFEGIGGDFGLAKMDQSDSSLLVARLAHPRYSFLEVTHMSDNRRTSLDSPKTWSKVKWPKLQTENAPNAFWGLASCADSRSVLQWWQAPGIAPKSGYEKVPLQPGILRGFRFWAYETSLWSLYAHPFGVRKGFHRWGNRYHACREYREFSHFTKSSGNFFGEYRFVYPKKIFIITIPYFSHFAVWILNNKNSSKTYTRSKK